MNKKYIIRICDETYNEQNPCYFKGFDYGSNSFYVRWQISEATEFVKRELEETVESIEHMFEINSGNGVLDHIEILDAETLQVVEKWTGEISRFDLMDFD